MMKANGQFYVHIAMARDVATGAHRLAVSLGRMLPARNRRRTPGTLMRELLEAAVVAGPDATARFIAEHHPDCRAVTAILAPKPATEPEAAN